MKILSMTATFGKLEQETLTLKPGLTVLEAPNEWGKSTWCAFLVAMLYGIETRVHSTKTALADKERYAPWSGSPMSGSMDIIWNDREITLERRTKGRSIFGDFRAYETNTGLPVPELTAANCGQVLLGVEKSVFLRSAFIRLTDLPVTADESLRRRLNALVTTADESNNSDLLAQKLRELKNRCRFNKTGLLPQAESQQTQLQDKLNQLHSLQSQVEDLKQRQIELKETVTALENHSNALAYLTNRSQAEKLREAKEARNEASRRVSQLESQCAALPSQSQLQSSLTQLQQLRNSLESLHMQDGQLPPSPQAPMAADCFRGLSPQEAIGQADADRRRYDALTAKKKASPVFLVAAILLLIAGVVLFALSLPVFAGICAALALVSGIGFFLQKSVAAKSQQDALSPLLARYGELPPERWLSEAAAYADAVKDYEKALQAYQASHADLSLHRETILQQINALTQKAPIQACQSKWESQLQLRQELESALQDYRRSEELLQVLEGAYQEVSAPSLPDSLTYSPEETQQRLKDAYAEQQQLQLKLGQYLGQMESLGQESALTAQLSAVNQRIQELERIYSAILLAQETLTDAANTLQRRFAPRISGRAQELFHKLTGSRYTRLTLTEDFSLEAATGEDTTLRQALWRSDGTVDQLYLALRLAVAEELAPNAPLILDDAFVRFDDQRLQYALEILQKESETKQVLLFTCQSREKQFMD